MKTNVHFCLYLAEFFSEREIFQIKLVEKNETHIVCSLTSPPTPRKSRRLWDNVEKCCRAGQDTDDSMAHARCMLGNKDYTHSEYVIFIAVPQQQWLHKRVSCLCYIYIARLVEY